MTIAVQFFVFLAISITIAFFDIKYLIIPNSCLIVLFIILLTLDLIFYRDKIPLKLLSSAFGGFFFIAIYYLTRKGIGLGDVKYSIVIAYYLGAVYWFFAIISACLCAIAVYCVGKRFWKWGKNFRIPFGPFLALGSVSMGLYGLLI